MANTAPSVSAISIMSSEMSCSVLILLWLTLITLPEVVTNGIACNETEEALKNSFNGADAVGPSLSFLPFSDHHA